MKEIWKPIPDYEEYEASSKGRIRRGHRVLSHCFSVEGYPKYSIKRRTRYVSISGHSMTCAAFHGPMPTPKHEVRHLDGSKDNNNPENLRWGTRKENVADKKTHGTSSMGEGNGNAFLTKTDVLEIRNKYSSGEYSQRALASEYNISKSQLSYIVTRQRWACI